jgi:predicted amidohydrolase
MKEILLTLVQTNCVAGDYEGNLGRMRGHISGCGDSDIVCFPEMCLSGYTTREPGRYALDPDSRPVEEVRRMAEEFGTSVVFGFMETADDGIYMRQEIAEGSGRIHVYRKTHLGANEAAVFSAGDELPVFDIGGVRTAIQLCIESHIQDICSTYRRKGAELVLTPFANGISGDRRKAVWQSYMPARASDNGMFVAACSATGDNGEGAVFGGGLLALDPKGKAIDEYYGTDEYSITVRIGGKLPRDGPETMSNISYFDRRRPELYE